MPVPLNCALYLGFTTAYDASSNKLFERALHAECRSFLYGGGSGISGYDSSDRLLQFQRGLLHAGGTGIAQTLSTPNLDSMRQYNLDLLGNWVNSESVAAVTIAQACEMPQTEERTTNSLNQIATIQDPTDESPFTLSYDLNGNLLDDGILSYEYDAFNRLRNVYRDSDDHQIAAYYYDAQNRRVMKIISNMGLTNDIPNGTINFIYDGQQIVEERDASNALLRQYVWGRYIDELLQQREYQNAPAGRTFIEYYPLADLHHRTVALTDDTLCGSSSSSGTGGGSSSSGPFEPSFVEIYDFDAYGVTTIFNSPGPDGRWFSDDDMATNNPRCCYLFMGRYYDPETQLYDFRARAYGPVLGRFLSRDPEGYDAGMSLYQAFGGNPVSNVDPMGSDNIGPSGIFGITADDVRGMAQQANQYQPPPAPVPAPAPKPGPTRQPAVAPSPSPIDPGEDYRQSLSGGLKYFSWPFTGRYSPGAIEDTLFTGIANVAGQIGATVAEAMLVPIRLVDYGVRCVDPIFFV